MKLCVCVLIIVTLSNHIIAGYGNFGRRGSTSGGGGRTPGGGERSSGGGRTLGGGGRTPGGGGPTSGGVEPTSGGGGRTPGGGGHTSGGVEPTSGGRGRTSSFKIVCRPVYFNPDPARPAPANPTWQSGIPITTVPSWNPEKEIDPESTPVTPSNPYNPNPANPTYSSWMAFTGNEYNPIEVDPTHPSWNSVDSFNPNQGNPIDSEWNHVNPHNPNPANPTDSAWNSVNPYNPNPANPTDSSWNHVTTPASNSQGWYPESSLQDTCSGSAVVSGTCDFYDCFVNCGESSTPALAAASKYCKAFSFWNFDAEGEAYITEVIKCQARKLGPFIASSVCTDVDNQAISTLIGQTKESDCFYQNGKFCDVFGKPQNAEAAAKIFSSSHTTMDLRMFRFFQHIYEADCPGTAGVYKNNFAKPFMNSMRNMMRMRMNMMRGQGDK